MIRHLATATTIALLALTACGSEGPATQPPQTLPPTTEPPTEPPSIDFDLPTDPNAIVLQLDVGVNQPDPVAIAGGYPVFTLYADGRLIARDRSVESGDLPPLVATRLDAEGVRKLVGLAISRGALDPLDSYGYINLADGNGYGFVVTTADRSSRFGVYGLGGEGSDGDDFTTEERAARAELVELRNALRNWVDVVGDHVVDQPELFSGDRILLIALDETVAAGVEIPADTSGGMFYDARIEDLYCVELTVADSPGLVEAITSVDRHGGRYLFRQVLPHEPGCALVSEL
ncbi:MAG: hypothetical protein HKN44_10740 [Ilumatobacter sp.]|nr:hypothetical protein [Ilumatobacter sp.]